MPRGSCLCGNVQYEYDMAPMKAICHCMTCRKITGSCFATTVLVPDPGFRLLSDDSSVIVTETPHESGMTLSYRSCAKCHNTLFKRADGFPGATIVFVGTLDKKEQPAQNGTADGVNGTAADKEDIETEGAPHMELWTKYRVPWLKALGGGVKEFEGFPPHPPAETAAA